MCIDHRSLIIMRRWKSVSSVRIWVAIFFLAVTLSGTVLLVLQLRTALSGSPATWPIGQSLFLQLVGVIAGLAFIGYLAYNIGAALTLGYGVDRNGAYIFWMGNRAVIPLAQIESVESGISLPINLGHLLQNLGYFHGQRKLPSGRPIHCFTRLSPAKALVLHTTSAAYAISPVDADSFVQELEQRRRIGAIQQLSVGVEPGRFFFYPFWNDRLVRSFLLVAFGLNLAVLGWLMTIFPNLPEFLAVRTDAAGVATALEPRHQVLFLPLAACVVSLMNVGLGLTIYAREPIGARFLQMASVVAQILFAVAVISIIR